MSTYEEISYINEISKQLTEMEETIDKMKQAVEIFSLNAEEVNTLASQASKIKSDLYIAVKTIREIKEREHLPEAHDMTTRYSMERDIQKKVKDFNKDFLPKYQEKVEQIIGNRDKIEKKVAEKRQAGEKVPSEGETKKALEDAERKLAEAVKEKPNIPRTIHSVKSFIEKAKPYIKPLVSAAKIALMLI